MKFSRLFVILIAVCSPLVTKADTPWHAEGEWLHLPAGEKSVILIDRLIDNDTQPPAGPLTISVLGAPLELTVPVGNPDRLVFDAEYLTYGDYPFSYRIEATTGESAIVDSVISLVPEIQPIAGAWSSILGGANEELGFGGKSGGKGGESAAGCEVGDGAELGWYQSRLGLFTLCDFNGTQDLVGCVQWQTPEAAQESGPAEDFRLAMVADWDGDGVDEPALYDPQLGVLQTYDYSSFCGIGGCLVSAAQLVVGQADALPLAGHWRSAALEFAHYDLIAGELTGPDGSVVSFSAPSLAARPVAGAWSGGGLDSLGLWHDASSELHYLADSSGSGGGTLPGSLATGPAQGFAFAGRWSDCGAGGDFLGIYQPTAKLLSLVPSAVDGSLRGLHVKVVVDPGGGGD